MIVPDRLSALIVTLEAGAIPTIADLRRIQALQALDLARIGLQFVTEQAAENAKRADELEATNE